MACNPKIEPPSEFTQKQQQAYRCLSKAETEVLRQVKSATAATEVSWKLPNLPASEILRGLSQKGLIAPRDRRGCIVYQNIYRGEL